MSAEQLKPPSPICEACWLKDHSRWEPESIDDKGDILMRLTGVDIPEKYNTDTVETCKKCNGLTIAGIYEIYDPSKDFFITQLFIDTSFENIESDDL